MITVKTVLNTLDREGFFPALWTLKEVEGIDRERRLLAVAYARRVQHLMTNPESVNALIVAERYANGGGTEEELQTAMNAAWDAHAASDADANADAAAAWASRAHAAAAAAVAAAPWAAYAAVSKTERDWQIAELRRVCECIEAGTDPYPRTDA